MRNGYAIACENENGIGSWRGGYAIACENENGIGSWRGGYAIACENGIGSSWGLASSCSRRTSSCHDGRETHAARTGCA